MKKHSQTGRPPKARERRHNSITFRVRRSLGDQLRKIAAKSERSLSDEIEHRLEQAFALEATKGDIDKMHAGARAMLAEAKAALDAARVQALRVAGLMILREIEGRPTRVIVDLETLLAEADGVARAMRSGFFPRAESPPALEAPRPMTDEEAARAREEIKRMIDEAVARTRAADAEAAKSDDEAA